MAFSRAVGAVLALALAAMVRAEEITVGPSYPIAERDALAEIRERAAALDPERVRAAVGKPNTEGPALPRAEEDRTRHYTPWHTSDVSVTDARGQVIYPTGYRFNPLQYVTYPKRIVVVGDTPEEIAWLKARANWRDMVLVAGDAAKVNAALDWPAFLLPDNARERLGVERRPSVVTQQGERFRVEEFNVWAN